MKNSKQENITMTRQEAINKLSSNDQVKITHKYFTDDEYIKSECVNGVIHLIDENGYELPWSEFWNLRKGDAWESGWSIKE